MLAGYVPQGHVDGAEGGEDGGGAERRAAVQVLVVVVDGQRVLAGQVAAELVDDLRRGGWLAPECGLADPCDTGVGLDGDQEPVFDEVCGNALDLHLGGLPLDVRRVYPVVHWRAVVSGGVPLSP